MTRFRIRLIRWLAGKDISVVINARFNGKGDYVVYLHSDKYAVCNSDFDPNRAGKGWLEVG